VEKEESKERKEKKGIKKGSERMKDAPATSCSNILSAHCPKVERGEPARGRREDQRRK
jgi:hypothetical protein